MFLLVSCTQSDPLEGYIQEHKDLAMHFHPKLRIEIDGKEQLIPRNVGISDKGMRYVHTHNATGELHIEGPKPQDYYLRDFFTIWGKKYTGSCIFDYCTNDTHEVQMWLNGVQIEDGPDLLLVDHDDIVIRYVEKK